MITSRNRSETSAVAALVCVLAVTGAVLAGCGSSGTPARAAVPAAQADAMTHDADAEIALYAGMRTLWAQHMEWTYATVVAFASDSPALQPTIQRLLANQADIGAAIAPYYGAAAGKQLAALLTTHIEEAVPVLTAARSGDKAALAKAVAAWYGNAREIADFLAGANPNWKRADMRRMMKGHITQTITYASDVLGGDFEAAIRDYGLAEAHMAEMADMLSHGLVHQFHDKF